MIAFYNALTKIIEGNETDNCHLEKKQTKGRAFCLFEIG